MLKDKGMANDINKEDIASLLFMFEEVSETNMAESGVGEELVVGWVLLRISF